MRVGWYRRNVIAGLLLAVATAPSATAPSWPQAGEQRTDPGVKPQRDAVHFLEPLKHGDPTLADALDGAVASLEAGHDVVILFDARSVTTLRMNPRRGNVIPLQERAFSDDERRALASRLRLAQADAPRNYLEYVQHLATAGAKVFANRTAARLYGLSDDELHPIATPISARQMSDLLDEAELCYTYGKH